MIVWGATDLYGSRGYVDGNGHFVPSPDLLFDAQYRPKEAVAAINKVLQGAPGS